MVLQKKCIRIVFGMGYRDHCKKIFIENKILTVYSLYILECVRFILGNSSFFVDLQGQHNYDTRFKSNLRSEKPNFSFIQKNVTFNILKVWNKLPISVRQQPANLIKIKLKKFLLGRAYYSLEEFHLDRELNETLVNSF